MILWHGPVHLCFRDHPFSDRISAVPPMDSDKLYRNFRPRSAPSPRAFQLNLQRHSTVNPPPRPKSAQGYHPARSQGSPRLTRRGRTTKAELCKSESFIQPDTNRSNRPQSARVPSSKFPITKPLIAGIVIQCTNFHLFYKSLSSDILHSCLFCL